jgi:uncharacterized cupin superfamily protein
MRTWAGVAISGSIAAVSLGCGQKPVVPQAAIDDKVYTVTPDKVKVTAGIVNGEVTELKVMERVEQGSGRVDTAAKLTGKLKLTNGSADQTVRLLSGRIIYIDDQGQVIKMEEARTEPAIKFANMSNSVDRLDPGQDMTQAIDVDFPAGALKASKLKEMRIELAYIPSAYKVQTANFGVSIGTAPAAK